MEELYKKIEIIIKNRFPSEDIRNEALEKIGKVVIFETLDKTLGLIPNEINRKAFAAAIESGNISEAEKISLKYGINTDEIMAEISKSIIVDLFEKSN